MKGYSTFSKALRLEPHHQVVLCHAQDTHWSGRGLYLSAEILSVYSTAPDSWATVNLRINLRYVRSVDACVALSLLKYSFYWPNE